MDGLQSPSGRIVVGIRPSRKGCTNLTCRWRRLGSARSLETQNDEGPALGRPFVSFWRDAST